MRSKTFLVIVLAIKLIILVSIVILFKAGLLACLDFYKDFVINIAIATLTVYLLISERKLKIQTLEANALQDRISQHLDALNKKAISADQFKEQQLLTNEAFKKIHTEQQQQKQITTLLTVFTISAAILSIMAYIINVIT